MADIAKAPPEAWHLLSLVRFGVGLVILAVCCVIAYRLMILHRDLKEMKRLRDEALELAAQAKGEATEAMSEAKSAHTRLDQNDIDKKGEREDKAKVFDALKSIKGKLNFMMHKDVRDNIEEQERLNKAANKGSDE